MTGFMPIKTLDDADQHLDDTQRIDSDGEGTRKDNARWRDRLYESDFASNALAKLGSLLSFQRSQHLSPEPIMFCFLSGVLTKGEINEEILILLRSAIVTSATAWNSNQVRLLTCFKEIFRRDVVHV
jgi:hypothetical protein